MINRKYVYVTISSLVIVVFLCAFAWFYSCQGSMQRCYASFRELSSNSKFTTRERQRLIHGGFAASRSAVAFPIPLEGGASGIILVDRSTETPSLIAPAGYTHWAPHFSSDGERLVFARQQNGSTERELLSCKVSVWVCNILFKVNTAISSPVDIGNGTIIFSMNALHADQKDKWRRFDLFTVRNGQTPVRLTEYEAYVMSPISVGGNKIAFAAEGQKGFEPNNCADSDRSKCNESNIYILDLVRSEAVLAYKPPILKPSLIVAGYSVGVALSGDGTKAALLNTSRRGNPWRYNMIVTDLDGVIHREIKVEGLSFSSGAFVENTLLVNELFDEYYRVMSVNLNSGDVSYIKLDIRSLFTDNLKPISLILSD